MVDEPIKYVGIHLPVRTECACPPHEVLEKHVADWVDDDDVPVQQIIVRMRLCLN